jgi:hypothetical protein
MKRFAPLDAVSGHSIPASIPCISPPCNCSVRRMAPGRDSPRDIYDAMRACPVVAPMFLRHPATTRGGTSIMRWTDNDDVDIDYHLRCTPWPAPGGNRELLELVSQLHSSPLDRHKPLWEVHLSEGQFVSSS